MELSFRGLLSIKDILAGESGGSWTQSREIHSWLGIFMAIGPVRATVRRGCGDLAVFAPQLGRLALYTATWAIDAFEGQDSGQNRIHALRVKCGRNCGKGALSIPLRAAMWRDCGGGINLFARIGACCDEFTVNGAQVHPKGPLVGSAYPNG
ncbi:hypothetical protein [Pseudooceanicola marinus]|uniref:hypothetical protein n=1 Tax=Pseudooceanicola marinus TaxID=396013 RepID=UPI00117AC5F4|nr:hypothetical protein [Pseudooceanicola marinus]